MNPTLKYAESEELFAASNTGAYLIFSNTSDGGNTSVNFTSTAVTAFSANGTAANRGLTPSSYTFFSTEDMYQKIFSEQCARVSAFIYGYLEQLDRSDDDYNEKIIERISEAIDLVGEPASGTAVLEAQLLREDRFVFDRLLLAIASARHKETEPYRLNMLRGYAQSENPRTRRAAVRALGRMDSEGAKSVLREISRTKDRSEVSQMASAFLR